MRYSLFACLSTVCVSTLSLSPYMYRNAHIDERSLRFISIDSSVYTVNKLYTISEIDNSILELNYILHPFRPFSHVINGTERIRLLSVSSDFALQSVIINSLYIIVEIPHRGIFKNVTSHLRASKPANFLPFAYLLTQL